MRQRRRQLSRHQQAFAAQQLFRHLRQLSLFRRSRRIAFYVARDGEISPHLLMRQARAMGKRCYLPVMRKDRSCRLFFMPYEPGSTRRESRYRIEEPRYAPARALAPAALNLVLMPLVAFDDSGARLGMGKGYYDRSFAFTRRGLWPVRLVGLAHECQRVEKLEAAIWDVPLEMIATDRKVYWTTASRSEPRR